MTFQDRQMLEDNGGMTALRELYGLTPPAVGVLFMLVRIWQPEKGGCYPTYDEITNKSGLPYETVRGAIKQLAAKGLISYERLAFVSEKTGRIRAGKINHYKFHIDVSTAIVEGRKGRFDGPDRLRDTGPTDQYIPVPQTSITGPTDQYIPVPQTSITGPTDQYIPVPQTSENKEVERSQKKEKVEITPSAAPDGAIFDDLENQNQDQNLNGNGKTGAQSETNAVPVPEAVPPLSPPVAVPPPSPQKCATPNCDNMIVGAYTCDDCMREVAAFRERLQARREGRRVQDLQAKEERDALRAEVDGLKQERDQGRADFEREERERDALRAEVDGLKQERDQGRADFEREEREREERRAERKESDLAAMTSAQIVDLFNASANSAERREILKWAYNQNVPADRQANGNFDPAPLIVKYGSLGGALKGLLALRPDAAINLN